jgi:hypothetical protein
LQVPHFAPGRKTRRCVEPPELEVPKLVALPNMVPRGDLRGDDAGGDLDHADGHERPQADRGVVGLDQDDRSRRHVHEVAL